jgi:hypothetical protein
MLTQRKYCVAQSVKTVPLSLEEGKCGDKYDYCGHILVSVKLVNMYIFKVFKINFIPQVIFLLWPYYSVRC